ncbi:MAG TPA: 50S ribosomal protein L21 [Chthonomonadaceae bacterium]|jgi:large subunit ribosomal protein L21|nr:50S ribosomal protein L21 [Chthonomonadaceae bacterium]
MYAIIKTGGKQYKVSEGSVITVEKLEGEPDSTVELTEVLAVSGDNGLQVGVPTLAGAKVVAKIVSQFKGKKIKGFTYKPKKNQHRRYGHRQRQTRLHIESIQV